VPTAAGLAYREAGPPDGPVALLLHGYPESSYMWRDLLPELADAGWHAVAPDLAGMGDSPADLPGSWERHADSIERLRTELGIESCVPVLHDWGGLIGLRWACEQPQAVRALVISASGFFPDGKWHGFAEAMRTPGQGEEFVAGATREAFGLMLGQLSRSIAGAAVDEYWKAFGDDARRQAQLDFYRSMDFEKIAPYEPQLAALEVPVLLVFGDQDPFVSTATARRFERELADTELVLIEDAGHFVWEDAPVRCAQAVTAFLAARL
jgi:haloalkane dehalogenase